MKIFSNTLPAFLLISLTLLSMTVSLKVNAADKRIQPDILYPRVKIVTNIGEFTVELNRKRAPITVDNFLTHVVNKEYNGTVFHRLITGFVAQAGGYDTDFKEMKKGNSIVNESGNGLKNRYGTIAMARMNDPHSATRQFFFNLADNKHLDPGKTWGYAVFGEVEQFEVIEQIETLETEFNTTLNQPNVPKKLIVINRIELLPYN